MIRDLYEFQFWADDQHQFVQDIDKGIELVIGWANRWRLPSRGPKALALLFAISVSGLNLGLAMGPGVTGV